MQHDTYNQKDSPNNSKALTTLPAMGDFLERSDSEVKREEYIFTNALNYEVHIKGELDDSEIVRENIHECNRSYKSLETIKTEEDVADLHSTAIQVDCGNGFFDEQVDLKGQVSFDESLGDGHRITIQINSICEGNSKKREASEITQRDILRDGGKIKWLHCRFCEYKTKHRQILVRHFIVKHDEVAEWLQCQFCEYRTKVENDLKRHLNYTHNDNVKWYTCQSCEFKTKRKSRLRDHINCKHKANTEWLQCGHCDYKTKLKVSFTKHVKYRHDDNLKWLHCKLCEYKTIHEIFLTNHHKKKHLQNIEANHQRTCSEQIAQNVSHKNKNLIAVITDEGNVKGEDINDRLGIAERSAEDVNHTDSRENTGESKPEVAEKVQRFHCKFCKFVTKKQYSLARHFKLIHSDDVEWFQCQFCEYRAKDKSNLRNHLKRKHNDNIEWRKCLFCDYKTREERYLIDHFNSKHNKNAEWLQCLFCNYRTKGRLALQRHVRYSHNENRQWHNCELCKYKTKTRGNLARHHRIKHEETVDWYHCEFCDFKAKIKSDLKPHFVSKHDKNAEWLQCHICDYKTRIKTRLSHHVTLNHAKRVRDMVDNEDCKLATSKDEVMSSIKIECDEQMTIKSNNLDDKADHDNDYREEEFIICEKNIKNEDELISNITIYTVR